MLTYTGLLVDTCRVVRRTAGAFNTTTGLHAAPTDATIYEGACAIQPFLGPAPWTQVGEEAVTVRGYYVFVPPAAAAPRPEDIVIVLTSEDAAMVGRELAVRDTAASFSPRTDAAVRWMACQDPQEGP